MYLGILKATKIKEIPMQLGQSNTTTRRNTYEAMIVKGNKKKYIYIIESVVIESVDSISRDERMCH